MKNSFLLRLPPELALLCLLLSGCASDRVSTEPEPVIHSLHSYLESMGEKLNCHFTLEYGSDSSTWEQLGRGFAEDSHINSVSELIVELRRNLKGFRIGRDRRIPNVVNIIGPGTGRDRYPLDQKVDLRFSGYLVGRAYGNDDSPPTVHEGIVEALSRHVAGMKYGSIETTSGGRYEDLTTQVSVNVTNERVRSILALCLPVDRYRRVLWRAVSSEKDGAPTVFVWFYGPGKWEK